MSRHVIDFSRREPSAIGMLAGWLILVGLVFGLLGLFGTLVLRPIGESMKQQIEADEREGR